MDCKECKFCCSKTLRCTRFPPQFYAEQVLSSNFILLSGWYYPQIQDVPCGEFKPKNKQLLNEGEKNGI
jgi:hypothetical protein